MTSQPDTSGAERDDLLQTLNVHRSFLRQTVKDLTDEQAARRTTVSALCLGGLIKHVSAVERAWADFITDGPNALGPADAADVNSYLDGFRMLEGETLAGLLEEYDAVAKRTNELVADLPDLDRSQPLPEAPWFEPGARRSARRTILHIIAETAQHAGHADIIREALDGSKTMG
jgi:uncharacterized damage-inducible protein DinB